MTRNGTTFTREVAPPSSVPLREVLVFTETTGPIFRSGGFEFFANEVLEKHPIEILRMDFTQ